MPTVFVFTETMYYRLTANAANTPPSKGAAMNTQSCASAVPPSNRAGASERAGLTDVPVSGMQTIWISTSVRPIAVSYTHLTLPTT